MEEMVNDELETSSRGLTQVQFWHMLHVTEKKH
jgi:hypothetical protein